MSLAPDAPRSDSAAGGLDASTTADEPDGGDGFAVVSSRFADWQRPAGEGQRQAALGTISGGRLGMVAPGVMAGGDPTASAETENEAMDEAIDPAGAVPTPASMVRPYFPETPPLPAPRAEKPKAAEPAAKSNGKIVRSVNMRSRPATGSSTITVIPGGSSVGVVSCRYWCQVEYDGRRGYVYKSFLQR